MDPRSLEPSFYRPTAVNLSKSAVSPSNTIIIQERVPPPAHGGSIVKRTSINSHGTSNNNIVVVNSSASSSLPYHNSSSSPALLLMDHRSLTPAATAPTAALSPAIISSTPSSSDPLNTSRMAKDSSSSASSTAPVIVSTTSAAGAAGLWRPPSLSPKYQQQGTLPSSSSFRPMDGRTSAPPAAHQSSSVTPVHHVPLGHLPPPLPPPPQLQRISAASPSAAAIHSRSGDSIKDNYVQSIRSSSVPNPPIANLGGGTHNRSCDQINTTRKNTSTLIQSHPAHHTIYSPIPGYSHHPVNGTTTATTNSAKPNQSFIHSDAGLRSNGQPLASSSSSRSQQQQSVPQPGIIGSKSSSSNFMSVDSLISNSSNSGNNNSLRSSPSTTSSFLFSSTSSSSHQELGHHLKQQQQLLSTTSSGSKPDNLNSKKLQHQPESSSASGGNNWNPNNRSSYPTTIHHSSQRNPMNPGLHPGYPIIPGISPMPGMITTGSHVVQSPQYHQQSQQQYHHNPLSHSSLKSSSPQHHQQPGHLTSTHHVPLIVPPAAHQSNNVGKQQSRPSISSIMNTTSSTCRKNEKEKKLKNNSQGMPSNQGQSGQNRAAVLMFPQGVNYPPYHLSPASNPTAPGHNPIMSSSLPFQLTPHQFHPIQIGHPRSLSEGMKQQQIPPHNLSGSYNNNNNSSFNSSQVCDNSSTSSSNSSFVSITNQQHVMKRGSNNGTNNQVYHHHNKDPGTTSSNLDVGIKKSRKSDSSMNENSNDVTGLNNSHGNNVPSTSVSPTNSNHSSHSNSGLGHKSLKKFWAQKYQDTNIGASNSNNDDVTKSSSDVTAINSCQVSPASAIVINDAKTKNIEQSTKKVPLKRGPKMKSGVKALANDASGNDTSEAEKMSKEKKVGKKKNDESIKSGTKRPGAMVKKVAGKKAKKVTGIEEEEENESSNSTAKTTHHRDGNGSKSTGGNNNHNEPIDKDMIVDSEMTDVEDEDSSNCSKKHQVVVPAPVVKVPAKRGRKPKVKPIENSENGTNDNPETEFVTKPSKVSKASSVDKDGKKSDKDKFTSKVIASKSDQPYLQSEPCSEIAPLKSTILTRCRECKMTPYQKRIKAVGPSDFCRFYHFRKLFFHKELRAFGFSEPNDAKEEDLKIWIPPIPGPKVDTLKKSDAQFLIDFVSDHFCSLVSQERRALSFHKGHRPSSSGTDAISTATAWKTVVPGVREMCDVCVTTLFNIHWVCSDCGFVVCIDCYKSKIDREKKETADDGKSTDTSPSSTPEKVAKDRDKYNWLLCNSKLEHQQEKLMLTQIIPKSALWQVCLRLHYVKKVHLNSPCNCSNDNQVLRKLILNQSSIPNINPQHESMNGQLTNSNGASGGGGGSSSNAVIKMEQNVPSPLAILADVAIGNASGKLKTEKEGSKTDDNGEDFSALRELLSKPGPPASGKGKKGKGKKGQTIPQLNGVLKHDDDHDGDDSSSIKLNYFSRKITPIFTSKNLPSRVCTLEETSKKYKDDDIPHDWFCDGKLLVLKDTGKENNMKLFQEQWLRHQVN